MKKEYSTMEDELLAEYQLKSLPVRRMGAKRTQFCNTIIALDPDVASVFTDAPSVNAALRFLMKITHENPLTSNPLAQNILELAQGTHEDEHQIKAVRPAGSRTTAKRLDMDE